MSLFLSSAISLDRCAFNALQLVARKGCSGARELPIGFWWSSYTGCAWTIHKQKLQIYHIKEACNLNTCAVGQRMYVVHLIEGECTSFFASGSRLTQLNTHSGFTQWHVYSPSFYVGDIALCVSTLLLWIGVNSLLSQQCLPLSSALEARGWGVAFFSCFGSQALSTVMKKLHIERSMWGGLRKIRSHVYGMCSAHNKCIYTIKLYRKISPFVQLGLLASAPQ